MTLKVKSTLLNSPVSINFYYFALSNNNYSWEKKLKKSNNSLRRDFLSWLLKFSRFSSLKEATNNCHYKMESINKALEFINKITLFKNEKKVEYYRLNKINRIYGIFKNNIFHVILLDTDKSIQSN